MKGSWSHPEASGGPSARGGHACTSYGQDVYVFGGASREPQAYNDLWRLRRSAPHLATTPQWVWDRVASLSRPCSGASMSAVGGKLLVFGGLDPSSNTCSRELTAVDMATYSAHAVHASGLQPLPRHSHCAAVTCEGTLVVFGGVSATGALLNDTWCWDGRAWSHVVPTGPLPAPREMHSCAMLPSGRLLIFGGRGLRAQGAGPKVLADAAELDLAQPRWRLHPASIHPRCAHAAAALPPGLGPAGMLVWGGFDGEHCCGDLIVIASEAGTATVIEGGVSPTNRFAHSCAVIPGPSPQSWELVVFGGINMQADLSDLAVWTCSPKQL